jgi:YVTN family beta-propeller protein
MMMILAKAFRPRRYSTTVLVAFLSLALIVALSLLARRALARGCTGDCTEDGFVTIEEIITGVGIAQDLTPLSECPSFDADNSGAVEVYELIAAVEDSLVGCGTPTTRFTKPTKSAPLALTLDNQRLVVANTDTNSVSIFEVHSDATLRKLKELRVGIEPRSVAVLPDGSKAYVANTVSGTVTVIDLDTCETRSEVAVGTEPWALAPTPNGTWIYVANANSNSVSVIRSADDTVIATINVGRSPRALAITNNNDGNDTDEKVYVPNFFARQRANFTPPATDTLGGTDGAMAFPAGARGQAVVGEAIFDDSREGKVDVIAVGTNQVSSEVVLDPLADTGFNFPRGAFVSMSAGDAPRTIFADGGSDGTVAQPTGAFPNQLFSIAIHNGRAYVPSSGASPEPPLRFNLNVQSLLSVIDTSVDHDAGQTLNMNRGIDLDLPAGLSPAQIRDNTDRMFPSVPVDIDCLEDADTCWVVSQGSDFIVRVDLAANGAPTVNAPTAPGPFDVSPVTRIYTIDPTDAQRAGRNPRGIVIDPSGIYAYVSCPTTRDVVVVNLAGNAVMQRIRSSELPQAGSLEEAVRRGKIDFFTSRPPWSNRGWGGCGSCHPDGRTDGVTWSFEAGPRQTISLDGMFSKFDPEDQRILNWTAVRDENQDFELNTRAVFGGRGFIVVANDVDGDGLTPDSDPNVRNFGPASTGRAQQQEDLTAFIQHGIRAPIAPPSSSGNVMRGRQIFQMAAPDGTNCVACHSGGKWTTSRVTYNTSDVNPVPGMDTGTVNIPPRDLDGDGMIDVSEQKGLAVFLNGFNSMAGAGRVCEVPPPPPGVDVGGTMASERIRILRQLGTFAGVNPIELRSNAISPVNNTAPALVVAAAFGGDGFNTPSLLGVFDSAPYFHHGAAETLEQVFGIGTKPAFFAAAEAHWRAGTGGAPNILDSDDTALTDLIAFVRSIDQRTTPFPAADLAPNDPVFVDANAQCDCQKDPPAGNPAIDCTP